MDWSKAKSILIVIFIMLNIFLSVILFNILSSGGISDEIINDAVKVLEERGVSVNADDLKLYNKHMGKLPYKKYGFSKEKVIKGLFGEEKGLEDLSLYKEVKDGNKRLVFEDDDTFVYETLEFHDNTDAFENHKSLKTYLNRVFKDTEIPVADFEYDYENVEENGEKTYKYRQKHKGFWVFENTIAVKYNNSGAFRLECRYKGVDSTTKKNKIVPLYQVLLKNYTGKNNITITKIDIGFKENKVEEAATELDDIPVWRVLYKETQKGGSIYREMFFKAYNGEILE